MFKSPKLKKHLRIIEAEIEGKSNIKLLIGYLGESSIKIEGDVSVLPLLELCDGVNSTNEIVEVMSTKFNISRNEVIQTLQQFEMEGLIEEGNLQTLLTERELDRYSRHLTYYSMLGSESSAIQEKLKNSTVTLIGMGGIGNWISINLVAAGVGYVRGVDNDIIELSNLTRQVLFSESDIGKYKVEIAKERLSSLSSDVTYEPIIEEIVDVQSAKKSIINSDIVILSADSPESIHYWIDEACYELKIPWLNVGYINHWGVCGPIIIPDKTSCLLCEMGKNIHDDYLINQPEINSINNRMRVPSFGPLNGLVSSFAAIEVIKFLTNYEDPITIDKRWMIDSVSMITKIIEYKKDEMCIQCGKLSIQRTSN